MRLDPRMSEALNTHVSVEATTAFRYLAMASWAEVRGLQGFAGYFRQESDGELNHMHQFVAYLNDMDFQATFGAIPAPPHEWSELQQVVEEAYAQELTLTKAINGLVALARETQDYFTESFLVRFIPSQIHDTTTADTLRRRVTMAGDGQGILMVDQELARGKGGSTVRPDIRPG